MNYMKSVINPELARNEVKILVIEDDADIREGI